MQRLGSPANIHAFHMRTKQLRYRIELARDLGESDVQAALGFLKSLQDGLGCWHDHAELFRLTTEGLADPEFLLSHARCVAALLRKSDREQAVQGETNPAAADEREREYRGFRAGRMGRPVLPRDATPTTGRLRILFERTGGLQESRLR